MGQAIYMSLSEERKRCWNNSMTKIRKQCIVAAAYTDSKVKSLLKYNKNSQFIDCSEDKYWGKPDNHYGLLLCDVSQEIDSLDPPAWLVIDTRACVTRRR